MWNTVTRIQAQVYIWATDHGLIFSRVRSSGSLKYFNPCLRTLWFVCIKRCSNGQRRSSRWGVFQLKGHSTWRQSHSITKLRLLFPDGWRSLVFVLLLYKMIPCSAASLSSWITSSERTYQSIGRRFCKLRLLCWDSANQEGAPPYSKVHFFNLLLKFWY